MVGRKKKKKSLRKSRSCDPVSFRKEKFCFFWRKHENPWVWIKECFLLKVQKSWLVVNGIKQSCILLPWRSQETSGRWEMGKEVCCILVELWPALYCRASQSSCLGPSFLLCKVVGIQWARGSLRWAVLRARAPVFLAAGKPCDLGSSLPSFFRSPGTVLAREQRWILDVSHNRPAYPLQEIAGRKLIQIFKPDHPPYSIWQGRPPTSLLVPTCHRTCCHMIQSPVPIKLNHPLENECTVNKVISWCLNFKQIASS